jgi:Formate hydrogenlyase subunit 3/Multisubunit Na+/H+ antiporter, MnhD subunit
MLTMILFPILAGVLISAVPALKSRYKGAGTAALILTDALGALTILRGGETSLFRLTETQALAFSVDGISRFFLILALLLYTFAGIYAMGYLEHDARAHQFFGIWFISMGAVLATCVAANLVTLYLSFEMATLTTMPLVLHDRTPESIAAAKKYLFYSIGGALMGLFAVLVLVPLSGGRFQYGGSISAESVAGKEGLFLTAVFLGIVGFGAKAGMYPMHGWLPTAHPVAPAPASSLLSGLIVKAGIQAVIRLVYFSAGPNLIRGTWVQTAWLCLALITVFMGSMMAWREKILKKRLAYSTVSQLSYIMLALALLCGDGLKGGLLHAAQHACSKGALFMCAGIFLHYFGAKVDQLKGIGKKVPLVLGGFTVAALSLVGIPPFGGFISKWQIAVTALAVLPSPFSYLLPAMLLLSALLTAGYLFTVVVEGFFPTGDLPESSERMKVSPLMTVPILVLCAGTLVTGLFGSGWIGGW